MKSFALISLCVAVSPIEKTIELLSDLQAKIVKDGENEQRLYEEFTSYCNDESKETGFEIKTGKSDTERAAAAIAEENANSDGAATKIEELASSIATNEKDLSAATEIRTNEKADFDKLDADLAETVSMLERATAIIEREMKKSSFVQSDSIVKITDALNEVINAAGVNAADKAKMQALMQTSDEDLAPGGAPDPASYESHSGGILDTLEDMTEKAKGERADAQKAEMNAAFNFKLLKQKLEDANAAGDKNMREQKQAKAAADEAVAVATGEHETATKGVKEDSKHLRDVQQECMDKAQAFETSQHERSGELAALGKAKDILAEKTGGAADRTYSFIQVKSTTHSKDADVKDRVVALVQRLAKEEHDPSLAQLAARLRAVSVLGADPFGKVKGMIQEMIEQLVAEAQKEAGHKAFCDKEMSETKAKKLDKSDEVDTLSMKIDKATAKIAKLLEEVATLQNELAAIAKAQREATGMREEEKAAWAAAKADFEAGVEGVAMALQVLRDYYAEKDESLVQTSHDKSSGAASGIIGMLEVVESDFSKMLADGTAAEDASQRSYDKLTQENKIATAEKTTAAKYKTKDRKETEAALAGLKEDRQVSQKELDAILDYWEKLQPMCVAKPEPYAERKRRREAEIAGLKEAARILEEESAGASFLQIRRA